MRIVAMQPGRSPITAPRQMLRKGRYHLARPQTDHLPPSSWRLRKPTPPKLVLQGGGFQLDRIHNNRWP